MEMDHLSKALEAEQEPVSLFYTLVMNGPGKHELQLADGHFNLGVVVYYLDQYSDTAAAFFIIPRALSLRLPGTSSSSIDMPSFTGSAQIQLEQPKKAIHLVQSLLQLWAV